MSHLPHVALLSDFGDKDGYVAVLKAVIATICHTPVQFIDISHRIPPQNVNAGAFVLWNSYSYFPEGTLFVCVVDPGVGSERQILAVETERYRFIAPDNGLLNFVLSEEKPRRTFAIENRALFLPQISQTFHGRDIFAPVAAQLINGYDFSMLGKPIEMPPFASPLMHRGEQTGSLSAKVLYIDTFGNVITNLLLPNPPDNGVVYCKGKPISIVGTYMQANENESLALTGSHGLLEIAIRNGNAALSLGLNIGDTVRVEL